MTIANAFKEFFYILNGVKPAGTTIADVVKNGTSSVQRNNESALTTRVGALEASNSVNYEAADGKSFTLNSSTTDSVKQFRVTVLDDGTLTATEVVAEEPGE